MTKNHMQANVGRKVRWNGIMTGPLRGVIVRVINRWKYEVRFNYVVATKADGTRIYTRACRARDLELL